MLWSKSLCTLWCPGVLIISCDSRQNSARWHVLDGEGMTWNSESLNNITRLENTEMCSTCVSMTLGQVPTKKTQGPGHIFISGPIGHLPHTETQLLSRSFRIFQYPSRQKVQLPALGAGFCYYCIFGVPLRESCCLPKGWSLSLSGEVSSSDPFRVNPGEIAGSLAKTPPFRKASHLKSR